MSIDDKLVERCIARDRDAQRTIFERYKSIMMGICMRYCKSRDEAEDVLMEGFMTIFSEAHTFRRDGAFEQWMKRIMINTLATIAAPHEQSNVALQCSGFGSIPSLMHASKIPDSAADDAPRVAFLRFSYGLLMNSLQNAIQSLY